MDKIMAFWLGLAIIAAFAFITAIFVRLLWNALMPALFGLPTLTYLQAYGLYLLSWMLFARSSGSSKD